MLRLSYVIHANSKIISWPWTCTTPIFMSPFPQNTDVCLPRRDISIQSSTLWSIDSATGIFKSYVSSLSLLMASGIKIILERLSFMFPHQAACQLGYIHPLLCELTCGRHYYVWQSDSYRLLLRMLGLLRAVTSWHSLGLLKLQVFLEVGFILWLVQALAFWRCKTFF